MSETNCLMQFVTPLEMNMILRGLIPAATIVCIGVVVGRWDSGLYEETLAKLSRYIYLPCLAFSAIHKHAFNPREIAVIALAVVLLLLVMTAASFAVLRERLFNGSRRTLAAIYMSSGTLLLPCSYVMFGSEGLAKSIYFHLFVLLMYHTAGLWLTTGTSDLRGLLKSPFIYIVAIGVAAQTLPVSMPETVEEFLWLSEKGIDLVALGALPLLLINFGYPLGLLKRGDIGPGMPGGVLRSLLSPVIALAIVYLFRTTDLISMQKGYDILEYLDNRTTESILILGAAMPASHFAMQLQGGKVAAKSSETGILLVSTLVAIATLPVAMIFITSYILD